VARSTRGRDGGHAFWPWSLRILPKVGTLKSVDIRLPSPKTEDLYIQSVNRTVDTYRAELNLLRKGPNTFILPNRDFDTGNPTKPSEYKLADETYAKLVEKLADTKFNMVTPELQANIVTFYGGDKHVQPPDMSVDEWRKVESAVDDLKGHHPGE
jgi:hypothetical protein